MSLEVQKFLRGVGSLDDLQSRFGISHRRHPSWTNLVLLKYDQLASPFDERGVQECRGIILDQERDWEVVSRSFDKFFNYGEGHASQVDWSTARVQEKLDGTLCVMYHYEDR